MQYGYFDDEAKEYVITRPDTPSSWSNYLGSTVYGAVMLFQWISQDAIFICGIMNQEISGQHHGSQ